MNAPTPALDPSPAPRLFDENGHPDFRTVFGRLLQDATRVDVALTRLRLSTLDLREAELRRLTRLRLLLARVDAVTLDVEAHGLLLHPGRAGSLLRLAALLDQGVIRVRAAPLAGWSPDFTVFSRGGSPRAVLLGFHWFQRPFPHRGPALASLHGSAGATLALHRFEILWRRSHDIAPALQGILARARSQGVEARAGPAGRRGPWRTDPGGEPARGEAPPGAAEGLAERLTHPPTDPTLRAPQQAPSGPHRAR
jgi:hypothetical protein